MTGTTPVADRADVVHRLSTLDRSKRGTWVYYRARPEALAAVADLFGGGTARGTVASSGGCG